MHKKTFCLRYRIVKNFDVFGELGLIRQNISRLFFCYHVSDHVAELEL